MPSYLLPSALFSLRTSATRSNGVSGALRIISDASEASNPASVAVIV